MSPLEITLLVVKATQMGMEAIELAQVGNLKEAEAKLTEAQALYAAGVAAWEAPEIE